MKKIMQMFFLSCLKATELIEKRLHVELSAKEKLQLRLHKMMCEACTTYEKHSGILEKGISSVGTNMPTTNIDTELLKRQISQKLEGLKKS